MRHGIPDQNVYVHVLDPSANGRFVAANTEMVTVGDKNAGDLLVSSILSDAMVLRHRETPFRVFTR